MSITHNLRDVLDRIADAACEASREADEIRLLAVSKTYPADVVNEVVRAGQVLLGENRVQEALEKKALLAEEISWHLIGPLQRNKVRKVVGEFACLQGIDSLKLASAVSRVATELRVTQQILLQVKIGSEETKSGFEAASLLSEIEALVALPSLDIQGLMTIPPPVEKVDDARPYFSAVRELREQLTSVSGLPLPELSMGMSGDYQAAIAEGSTMVRVGSAIFGKRS